MSASPYCPRCGAVNTTEATACFACGQALADAAALPESISQERQALMHQRYRRLQRIGTGGFGAVYKAEDTQLGNRLVAIKEMNPRALTPAELQEASEAFHREALLLARLSHPHLPRIYEQFEENGQLYLVMDFIEGQTLEAYLAQRGGHLPVREALQLGLQLTDVLGYLHSRQPPIIFRDLKPANVMRAPDGHIYLIDFGIARLFKPGQARDTIAFGSPGYAAPEQYGKTQTTPRSDVYSLGALLHHLLTGIDPSDKPFRFTPLTMRRPVGLSRLIERMVEIDAEKRPATMDVVRRDLERLLSNETPWYGDYPALTGAYPRVTTTLTSQRPLGAPPVYPPAPPPAWPQQHTLTSPRPPGAPLAAPSGAPPTWPQTPPGQLRPSPNYQGFKVASWLLLPLALCIGIPLFFALLGSVGSVLSGQNIIPGDDTPAPSGTPGTSAVPVYTLAWSPNGKQIASAGDASSIQIWDVADPQQVTALNSDFSQVISLAWSPDGDYIAAIGNKGEYEVWQPEGSLVGRFPIYTRINALAWSPDSRYLALAYANGIVGVVNATSGIQQVTSQQQSGAMTAVAWSPDGRYLAAGCSDGTVHILDGTSLQPVYTYRDDQAITALAWAPGSKRIASADAGGNVVAWDATTGQSPVSYTGSQHITALAWSPDGKYLAAGDQNGTVLVWTAGNAVQNSYTKGSAAVRTLAWMPDKTQEVIAFGSDDGAVRVWNALDGSIITTYQQS